MKEAFTVFGVGTYRIISWIVVPPTSPGSCPHLGYGLRLPVSALAGQHSAGLTVVVPAVSLSREASKLYRGYGVNPVR